MDDLPAGEDDLLLPARRRSGRDGDFADRGRNGGIELVMVPILNMGYTM